MPEANADQREYWNGDESREWADEPRRYDEMLEPFGIRTLEVADVGPGARVLDVGCGNGALTLEASVRAGAEGSATGIDLSEPMLANARARAGRAGACKHDLRRGRCPGGRAGWSVRRGDESIRDHVLRRPRRSVRQHRRIARAGWACRVRVLAARAGERVGARAGDGDRPARRPPRRLHQRRPRAVPLRGSDRARGRAHACRRSRRPRRTVRHDAPARRSWFPRRGHAVPRGRRHDRAGCWETPNPTRGARARRRSARRSPRS